MYVFLGYGREVAPAGGEINDQECSTCHPSRSDAVYRGIFEYIFVYQSVMRLTDSPGLHFIKTFHQLFGAVFKWGVINGSERNLQNITIHLIFFLSFIFLGRSSLKTCKPPCCNIWSCFSVAAQEEVGVAVAWPSCHLCLLHLLDYWSIWSHPEQLTPCQYIHH